MDRKSCCDLVQAEIVALNDICPNKGQIPGVPKNPRVIRDGKYELLKKSIQEDPEMMGLREILVYRYGGGLVIIGGNMRFRALKELGYTETAVKIIPNNTPADKLRRIVLKDNSGFGEWDFEGLTGEWDADDIAAAAIDIPEIDAETEEEEAKEDNYPVDDNIPEEPTAQRGDIYALGKHRLMCGDSSRAEDVAALMAGKSADALVTDPPYNVGYGAVATKVSELKEHGKYKKHTGSIKNDKMAEGQFTDFLQRAFRNAATALKKGGTFYIWHAAVSVESFMQAVRSAGMEWKQTLYWIKRIFTLGMQDYQNIAEPCLYGWKPGAAHYFCGRRNLSTVIEKLQNADLDKFTKEERRALVDEINQLPTNVLRESKPMASKLHPTMKPIKLMARNISASTRPGDIVLDLFGGSGSTMMAAEQLGRVCYMMEYEPKYVDVIIKRWEELTGGKAHKIGNANTDKKQG